jgi:thymidylate synthase
MLDKEVLRDDPPPLVSDYAKLVGYYQSAYPNRHLRCIDATYKDMLSTVLSYGIEKTARGDATLAIPGYHFCFDLSSGNFPLLGLKHTNMNVIAAELYGFIHGFTQKRQFHEINCRIWDEWCNPKQLDKDVHSGNARQQAQKICDDLGPIYGYQWSSFNHPYDEKTETGKPGFFSSEQNQLQRVLDKLSNDPQDRRLVVSAWNPQQFDQMALPPCHILWNVCVVGGHLNLHWHQRSCDLLLGVPFNIASYGLLLLMLARHAGLQPGLLFATFVDFHIYSGKNCDHTAAARELLQRSTNGSPSLDLWEDFSFWNWKHDQFDLRNYTSHPRIKLPVKV